MPLRINPEDYFKEDNFKPVIEAPRTKYIIMQDGVEPNQNSISPTFILGLVALVIVGGIIIIALTRK